MADPMAGGEAALIQHVEKVAEAGPRLARRLALAGETCDTAGPEPRTQRDQDARAASRHGQVVRHTIGQESQGGDRDGDVHLMGGHRLTA
jgi:hypothetical protein